ncbi:enoyl-CoA hydratase/isomerase family protein [Agarilytica rhodophyticola]|uniref:enoyl-CoA hydratase/isomerase family protein n=1 Tax=Agarilytica rhodophyticola TaxID=1737490 RepID=UPI000B346FCC|nr:enoyl-CoA hydratase/isomerase family protein [Agarilytica rhodophyticola]
MNNEFVCLEKDHRGIASVILSRPEKHNAFNDEIIAKLQSIFSQIADDDDIKAVILKAEGKSFSAGADLNWMRRMVDYNHQDNVNDARALANMLDTLNRIPKPTIARVQGAAYGGAIGLIACCDIAFATPAANFCLSEVKLGLIPATISPYVIAAIGQRACRRYFQTAEVFSATTAEKLGLLSEVVPPEHLDETIEKCLVALLANGSNAMREAKQLIFNVSYRMVDEELMQYTSNSIASARVSSEGQERLGRFLASKNKKN